MIVQQPRFGVLGLGGAEVEEAFEVEVEAGFEDEGLSCTEDTLGVSERLVAAGGTLETETGNSASISAERSTSPSS